MAHTARGAALRRRSVLVGVAAVVAGIFVASPEEWRRDADSESASGDSRY
jgi:hypothetical protein